MWVLTFCFVLFSVLSFVDDGPAPPAPFDHRIVSAKKAVVNSFYEVNRNEVLGG